MTMSQLLLALLHTRLVSLCLVYVINYVARHATRNEIHEKYDATKRYINTHHYQNSNGKERRTSI